MPETTDTIVTFFSEVDYKTLPDGRKIIASEYPVWYNRYEMSELSEDIQRTEFSLDNGLVPQGSLPQVKKRLVEMRSKLEKIEASIPNLTDKQKDRVDKVRKALAKEISSALFTRSHMMKGIADAHVEAERRITPKITVTPEIAEMCKASNVEIDPSGKISRDQAAKVYKICCGALEEMSDVEVLRRD